MFHKELHEFEELIIDFFIEIGDIKWNSAKISKIAGYIFLHSTLTQKQLKEMTGYALSTISANLNTLLAVGLSKRRIPRTHTFEYSFTQNFNQIVSEGKDRDEAQMLELIEFITYSLKKLEGLKEKYEEEVSFLSQRLSDLLLFAVTYKKLIDSIAKNYPIKQD